MAEELKQVAEQISEDLEYKWLETKLLEEYKQYSFSSVLDVEYMDKPVQFWLYDRGRRIQLCDNNIDLFKVCSEFLKQKIIPEIDAVRFATISNLQGVNYEPNLDYAYDKLAKDFNNVFVFKRDKIYPNFMKKCITVPTSRFWNNIEILDGVNNNGGYKGVDSIGYIALPKDAFNTAIKFEIKKCIDNSISLRVHHDLIVKEDMNKYIYVGV